MKSRLSLDLARYRRYQEPFTLCAENSRSFAEAAKNGSMRVTVRKNEQATLPAADQGAQASYTHKEEIWATQ
jgi:hypothetical protein